MTKKIYSAKLAESWPFRKALLCAATAHKCGIYEHRCRWHYTVIPFSLLIMTYTAPLLTYFPLLPMTTEMTELCIFYILPALLFTIQKLKSSLNVPGNV